MMCTDVNNKTLSLVESENNAEFLKSILLPVPCRFCLFYNFDCFWATTDKEFLELFPLCIKPHQIKSQPQNGLKSKVCWVQFAGLWEAALASPCWQGTGKANSPAFTD